MHRRDFHRLALLSCSPLLPALASAQTAHTAHTPENQIAWHAIESESQCRLGVAVFDTHTGQLDGYRLDERFPMCSTFKWLAAAHVLHRVDQGNERLDRRIRFGRDVLLPWSPVTEKHADGSGLTVGELCRATVATSDNAAGNLILQSLGGPEGLTRFARQQGDPVTRLDRWEPNLNEATPGDPRDTTSPRAMAELLNRLALGPALSPASRQQLAEWLLATRTNLKRLAAGLPAGWRVGSKTGTGPQGTTNDIGICWPVGRKPLVVAVLLTQTASSLEAREAVIARVAAAVYNRAESNA